MGGSLEDEFDLELIEEEPSSEERELTALLLRSSFASSLRYWWGGPTVVEETDTSPQRVTGLGQLSEINSPAPAPLPFPLPSLLLPLQGPLSALLREASLEKEQVRRVGWLSQRGEGPCGCHTAVGGKDLEARRKFQEGYSDGL